MLIGSQFVKAVLVMFAVVIGDKKQSSHKAIELILEVVLSRGSAKKIEVLPQQWIVEKIFT